MCGIAGIIHRDGPGDIGSEMTRMLQSMKHRGPDSTGYALYGPPQQQYVMRYKLAAANDSRGFHSDRRLGHSRREVEGRLRALGARTLEAETETPYAYRVTFD